MSELLSDCCNYPVTVEGRTTKYYVCDRCGKPCDIVGWEGKTLEEWNKWIEQDVIIQLEKEQGE